VRVLRGLARQPAAAAAERRVLERIGAAENVRLACQMRPQADVSIATLLPAQRTWFLESALFDKYYWGVEEQVTIMFCDLRGFTALSEKRLPFDTVFILNQYLSRLSEVIEDEGGYVDKFIGDGVMAIFGIGQSVATGADQALRAARAIGGVLDALNLSLGADLPEPLDIAIGIDTGTVILGRVGSAERENGIRHITALGDIVNTASRLEGACREHGVQLIVSERTLAAALIDIPADRRLRITVKGRRESLEVVPISKAIDGIRGGSAPKSTAK
jgi:adenylate cyclase